MAAKILGWQCRGCLSLRQSFIRTKNLKSILDKSGQYRCYTKVPEEGSPINGLPHNRMRLIMRPLLFTVVTGAVSFTSCAILQYERVRSYYTNQQSNFNGFMNLKGFGFRRQVNKWWNSLPDGSKTAAGIIFINSAVFLLWKIPRLEVMMTRWFLSHPVAAPPITMLTSCFSHMDIWHLGINMYVLWTFAPAIQAMLGREQFIAFYITGGVFASFASQAFRIATCGALHASLGASGALFAVLSAVCIQNPDIELALVFFPWYTFSAYKALIGVVSLDVCGLLMRWKMFDHAAHLGGVAFGAWYLKYGHTYLWDKRAWLTKQWHKLRSKNS